MLDERVPFLEGAQLHADESDAYFQPMISGETATLFEHCARGLDASLAVGRHGLPLFGAGDWNDGMNRVGAAGRGESVWLGWFLHAALSAFAPLADARAEPERAARWRAHAEALRERARRRRLGRRLVSARLLRRRNAARRRPRAASAASTRSRSRGASSPEPAIRRARRARWRRSTRSSIRRGERLALLFTPPFDRTPLDPGYIKGYPPGVRENGGQYTHAAVWSVIAFALLGDGDRAAELFSLLNPIHHSATRAGVRRYKVEPYAVAADVYSVAPHVGRGGWTWYTGSAGWLYRAGLEWILGFRVRGAALELDPCVPASWPGFEIAFRFRSSRYEISVENPAGKGRGVSHAELDGEDAHARRADADPARGRRRDPSRARRAGLVATRKGPGAG